MKMKKNYYLAAFFLLSFFATPVKAMQTEEFLDEATGDISALFTFPSLGDDVKISSSSDQNGVCIALGYEKAAVGALTKTYSKLPSIVINALGIITKAEGGSIIHQIVCLNKITNQQEATILASVDLYPFSTIKFHNQSNENGICTILGYNKGAIGSSDSDFEPSSGPVIMVDVKGLVNGGSYSDFVIKKVICIDKYKSDFSPNKISTQQTNTKENIIFIENPKHPKSDVPFSSYSNPDGICKALNYERVAKGSDKNNYDSYKGPILIVDVHGSVTAGSVAKGSYYDETTIKSLICVKKNKE